MSKILFLDRDGPIDVSGPNQYVHKPEYFHFTDRGIFDVCHEAMEKDYKIVVVTNQTGIGMGNYTEKDMESVNDHMVDEFKKDGIRITDIFYTKYEDSPNRKPEPGMFRLAKEKYELTDEEMFHSFAIGDRKKDALAALRAGVGNIVYYQTSKVMDENWQVIEHYPPNSAQEIRDIQKEFEKLVIMGALLDAYGVRTEIVEAKKEVIEPRLVTGQPKMMVIQDYKQIRGRL